MTLQNNLTWALLMVLTIGAGLLSRATTDYTIPIILLLAAVKFFAVAFYFMEMRLANSFWKMIIIALIVVFSAAVLFFSLK